MVCNNCKEEINETDKYCGNCGSEIVRDYLPFDDRDMLKAKVFSDSMKDVFSNVNPLTIDYSKEKNKKRNRKIFKIAFSSLAIILISIFIILFINEKLSYNKEGKRTVMIYMIGSDLESKYLAGTKDIDEIIDSSIDYDDVNILIYTGGSKKWHNENIPSDKHGLFEIDKNGLKKIDEFDNTGTMLEKDNLLFFLNYTYENYDTEYYDLILWDHGAGPIYGYGYDEYNKIDSMSISEIKSALKSSPFIGENKLELLGFDACLMSSIEVASTLSSYANYMVASQEFEPGAGWDYRFLEKVNSNLSSVDFGKLIIDYFNNYYSSKKYTKGISLSLLKLNKIDNVLRYTNDLFTKIDSDLTIDYSLISRTRSKSKTYGRISDDNYYYDLVDLNDLLDNLPEKYIREVSNLRASLSDLVIYQKTDLANTNGISIFFPFENKKELSKNLKIYKELDFSESYYNFINDFSNKLTNSNSTNWDILSKEMTSNEEGKISIILDENIVKNYSSASYVLFEKRDNNLFTPIFSGSDTIVDGNTLTTSIKRKSLVIKDNKDEMYLTAIENIKGTDYTSYYIPATITRFNADTLDIETLGVYIDFVVDSEHLNGFISNVYPLDLNENLTYSKIEYNLKDWDSITFLSFQYNILDSNGNYTSNWEDSPEVLSMTISTKDDIDISFKDLDISKEYYSLFKIKDNQNKIYYSNIVKVNK